MSELLTSSVERKKMLKHMILQLHEGKAPQQVRKQLVRLLGKIPYHDVVEVEQELISEGLPQEEVLRLCDVHTEALKGAIDQSMAKSIPPGHPVDTFIQENRALAWEVSQANDIVKKAAGSTHDQSIEEYVLTLRSHINALTDVEKHYQRKENLLFPYLEKYGITGPSTVMWGKHDETREFLASAQQGLAAAMECESYEELSGTLNLTVEPVLKAIQEMIFKEEEILFPMAMDALSDEEWYEIKRQSNEIGYCLFDPAVEWKPEGVTVPEMAEKISVERINLPSGSFSLKELQALLNSIPFDLTFVDREDKVRFFTQGKERIFSRNRAILGRDVHNCHPPKSVHIVERILNDFRNGSQDRAAFWIELQGRFIMIEYFALRDEHGDYLGTLEVSQDLTEKRALTGEQRLLNYETLENKGKGTV